MSSSAADRTQAWFQVFFQTVIAISTVGSSFTFTIIFAELKLEKPPTDSFDTESVRRKLSVCWLLFVVALALTSAYATLTALKDNYFAECVSNNRMLWPSLMSLFLQLLLV